MSNRSQKKSIFLSLFVSASFLLLTTFLNSDADFLEAAAESTSGMRQDGEQWACFCVSSCGKKKMIIIAVSQDKECAAEGVATHVRIKPVRARLA